MKKEEKKKSKKKKLLKIILGIGAGCAALYAADKYVPGFHDKITKPVKEFAKSLASDVKKEIVSNTEEKREVKIKREDSDVMPHRSFKERPRRHHHQDHNHRERRNY